MKFHGIAGHNPGPIDYILSDLGPRSRSLERSKLFFFANNSTQNCCRQLWQKLKCQVMRINPCPILWSESVPRFTMPSLFQRPSMRKFHQNLLQLFWVSGSQTNEGQLHNLQLRGEIHNCENTSENINCCVRGGHKPARWPWPTSQSSCDRVTENVCAVLFAYSYAVRHTHFHDVTHVDVDVDVE